MRQIRRVHPVSRWHQRNASERIKRDKVEKSKRGVSL
jgi:hypothetical protein